MNLKSFAYHPFLVVAFQILTIYSININEVNFNIMFFILIISLFSTTIIFGLISSLIDNRHGAIIVTCYGFLFFSYGRVLDIFIENPIFGMQLGRNRYFLPIFVLILIGSTLLLYKSDKVKKNLKAITFYSNKFSVGLVLISLFTAGMNYDWTLLFGKEVLEKTPNNFKSKESHIVLDKNNTSKPNVYFLIFDSYASHKVLNEYFSWNDSIVVNKLLNKGFSVGENTLSNYCFTGGSILSTLSMRYLHKDQGFIDAYNQDNYIGSFYEKNDVMERFKDKGYQVITNIDGQRFPNNKSNLLADDFISLVIHLSLLRIVANDLVMNQARESVLSILEGLKQFQKPKEPTFLMLHIGAPHTPFVFKSDGSRPQYFESPFGRYEDMNNFVEQVRFIGSQIIAIVNILQDRDPSAIIIIQSDHGYGGLQDNIYLDRNSLWARKNDRKKPPSDYLHQRFGILNAISSPLELNIPAESTPVNLFRYIFNELFEDNYSILPDKSYFAIIKQPYMFHDVTDDLNRFNYQRIEKNDQ